MNLSIVIPNYNGEKLLRKNLPLVLQAVKEYRKGFVEIIIPDDPSTDQSHQVIKEFIESIHDKNIVGKTIENKDKKQSGFANNVNRGVTLAKGDIIILLNTDVIPHKDFLSSLLRRFDDEKVFAVGCVDESVEDEKIILRGRGIGRWERGFLMHGNGSLDKDTTLWVAGGSGAFRKKIWDKLHGLDQLYNPFYWEDIDLSYRALKSGYKTYIEKESIVRHEHEKGAIKTRFNKTTIKRIAYRNQFIFVWKNITQTSLLLSHFGWLPYHLIKALLSRDWSLLVGFYFALVKLPLILTSRERAKKFFIVTDLQVITQYSL